MKRTVTKSHTEFPADPIVAAKDDSGSIISRETEPEWKGWIKCRMDDGQMGWISETYMNVNGDKFSLKADYSGQEIRVESAETVTILQENNGWRWIRKESGAEGWVPNSCFE